MRSKPKKAAANPTVIQDENLVSTIPGLERKGDANLCHQWQNVYFASSTSRLAIRLPEDKSAEFMKKYNAALFGAYGV
jgi:hypothetical protein